MSIPPSPSSAPVGDETGGEVLPAAARAAILEHLTGKPQKDFPPEVTTYLANKSGVFVTLRDKKSGEIKGTYGTVEAETENLVEETSQNAIRAATEDPDTKPVKDRRALNRLSIEVCVLGKLERVESIIELDPEIYGVVLTATKRGVRGVMLPNVPELTTVDKQLAEIRRQAGLRPDERLRIERFRIERFTDEDDA